MVLRRLRRVDDGEHGRGVHVVDGGTVWRLERRLLRTASTDRRRIGQVLRHAKRKLFRSELALSFFILT